MIPWAASPTTTGNCILPGPPGVGGPSLRFSPGHTRDRDSAGQGEMQLEAGGRRGYAINPPPTPGWGCQPQGNSRRGIEAPGQHRPPAGCPLAGAQPHVSSQDLPLQTRKPKLARGWLPVSHCPGAAPGPLTPWHIIAQT